MFFLDYETNCLIHNSYQVFFSLTFYQSYLTAHNNVIPNSSRCRQTQSKERKAKKKHHGSMTYVFVDALWPILEPALSLFIHVQFLMPPHAIVQNLCSKLPLYTSQNAFCLDLYQRPDFEIRDYYKTY